MNNPEVYDHLQPSRASVPTGIYRVVGGDDEAVTLLRVADAEGRRANTGELIRVTRDELNGFSPAENPDGNRPLDAVVRRNIETGYWSIRVFLKQLAAHPIPATIVILILVAGTLGEGVLPLSDAVRAALIIAGSLGVAYVGSGRLSR